MKSETINITSTEADVRSDALVGTFMLQQHRNLLVRQVVVRALTRVFFVVINLVVLTNQITKIDILLYALLVFVVGIIWTFENYIVVTQIRLIEKTFAQVTGGQWEDIYIRIRYETKGKTSYLVQQFEPVIWLVLISLILLSKYYLSRL